jgi:hypothetical protein
VLETLSVWIQAVFGARLGNVRTRNAVVVVNIPSVELVRDDMTHKVVHMRSDRMPMVFFHIFKWLVGRQCQRRVSYDNISKT